MTLTPPLRELLHDVRRACAEHPDARVVGERVKVRTVELRDEPLPILIAEVVRRGVAHRIALADLEAEAGSPLAAAVARCRALCGWSEPAPPAPVTAPPVEPGAVVQLAVLSVKSNAARCRPVGETATVTLRVGDLHRLVPGELATVRVRKRWRHAGHPYVSGEVEATMLAPPRLGLVPLRLEPAGDWTPDEDFGQEGEPIPERAAAIVADGARAVFEMEQVIPGADPEDCDADPITDAVDLVEAGDHGGARALLMKLLEADLRCLDAHAHLGNWAFDLLPEQALRHYEAGVRIGELSLPAGFDGLLPWGMVDNRPFLRCLHGYGLSLWRVGRGAEAAAVFRRMLRLNPSDNQGARFMVDEAGAGMGWQEAEAADAARAAETRRQWTPYDEPPRAPRLLPVDLSILAEALDDGAPGHAWYLDRETGDIFPAFDDFEDEFLPCPREELEDSSRFLHIEPRPGGEGWRDMADFVVTVDDRGLRERLADAIEGKGAFGRFRRVLESAPAVRERWFEWKGARLEEEARAWLAGKGIESVPGGGA
jgi:tetratricopeptide (TPR) repeat protein